MSKVEITDDPLFASSWSSTQCIGYVFLLMILLTIQESIVTWSELSVFLTHTVGSVYGIIDGSMKLAHLTCQIQLICFFQSIWTPWCLILWDCYHLILFIFFFIWSTLYLFFRKTIKNFIVVTSKRGNTHCLQSTLWMTTGLTQKLSSLISFSNKLISSYSLEFPV